MMFQNNLKIAFRSLLRRRTFATINITGLALGMTAAIFAFLWVQNEMSFDSYHKNADNIYRVNVDIEGFSRTLTTIPLAFAEAIKTEAPEAEQVAVMFENRWRPFTLKKDETILKGKRYTYINEDWLSVFDHHYLSGSAEGFGEILQSAILTKGFAEKLFGTWEVIGETFQIENQEFIVHAVIDNHPNNSGFSYQMLLPMNYYSEVVNPTAKTNLSNYNFLSFVKLNSSTNSADFSKKITTIHNSLREEEVHDISLQSLGALHFDNQKKSEEIATGNRQLTYTIAMIGFLILFLACINYVSITTAQAGIRTKEVGVRKIIGAEGRHIFRLLFTESIITTIIALVIALSAIQLAMPAFNNFSEKQFLLDLTNPLILLILGGTLLTTLLLSGIYPAIFLTGFSPGHFLKGQNFLKLKNTTFRKGLVVTQFAITVFLVIGAIIAFQQQDFIHKKDLGYNKSHVFEFQIPYSKERPQIVKNITQTLTSSPAILGTSTTNGSIIEMNGSHSGSLDWDGKPVDFVPTIATFSVDENFGEVMKLSLAEGRWFLPNNQADAENVIINEKAINQFQLPQPIIGQRLHFQGVDRKIIGVVKDFHYKNLRETIQPLVFWNQTISQGNIIVRTSENQISGAIAAASEAWDTHYKEQPFEYHFLEESFDRLYQDDQKNASLFQLLAMLAIFISCLGLFGLAVFSTEQRAKEIGVRKVLGASVVGIVSLLTKDFLKLILVALLITCPLAYFTMEEWLTNYAYRIDIEVGVFLLAGMLTISVALLTVGIQSIKAALANPIKSLRSE